MVWLKLRPIGRIALDVTLLYFALENTETFLRKASGQGTYPQAPSTRGTASSSQENLSANARPVWPERIRLKLEILQ